jgi:succinate-semialdehyde dehydrogenase / glutarate-semialdehyde dehydrogenase
MEEPTVGDYLKPNVESSALLVGSLIDGRWVEGSDTFDVCDKYTGAIIGRVSQASAKDVGRAVDLAVQAFEQGLPPPAERARILRKTADLLESRRNALVETLVAETGFTTADASAEVDRAVVSLRICAEESTRILGETVTFAATTGQHERIGFTLRFPVGVVCAITPFNSPLNTVIHKVAPAIAAGCPVILKPSPLSPLCSVLLCKAFLEAGLPSKALSLVNSENDSVAGWLLADPRIAFFSFTGSTRVGRIIQAAAGLRRTQLELGSIASTFVCKDADLSAAIPKIANASFRKAGQVCTSIQRLYADQSIVEELIDRLAQAADGMPAGDPRRPGARVGPMISESAAARAQSWVEQALSEHARVVTGGVRSGATMQPTVLTGVKSGLRVIDEEIFAPVVSVLPFADLSVAIADANATPYGLATGIFTRDLTAALRAAKTLRFGAIHINETSSSRADAMPFGGVKDSGHGHEGPAYAIRELTEERLVTITP